MSLTYEGTLCPNGHATTCTERCHECGAGLPKLLFDDMTIKVFLERTKSYMPPTVQLAIVAWFVGHVTLDDLFQLYDWFGFSAYDAEDQRLVN